MPLKGIKVLDLSRLLPGPFASQILADFGAEVIKVEDTNEGDYLRDMPPMMDKLGAFFCSINRGKKSIKLGVPVKLSDTPGQTSAEAPGPGQHTDMLLRELGFSEVEIMELRRRQIVA